MKKYLLLLIVLSSAVQTFTQQDTEIGRYRLRNHISSQDTVYMKIGKAKTVLKKGCYFTDKKDLILKIRAT